VPQFVRGERWSICVIISIKRICLVTLRDNRLHLLNFPEHGVNYIYHLPWQKYPHFPQAMHVWYSLVFHDNFWWFPWEIG